ncbi:MAG: LacI family DNA-binding transcriptional regulator, partial [Microbacterium sp.]|nr:LacI family DNA-binding transcriptional regulator [Microbacterium sp.]
MTRRATIREVARLAEVSLGTISNYLNNNKPIAPETRDRIESAIDQLGFIPNAGVRVMRGGRSHAIAFLIPDSGNPFLVEVARGIEDVAIGARHVVVTCNTDGDREREDHYARVLSEMRVVGAVAMAMSAGETALRRLEALS